MIFAAHGHPVDQKKIVERVFGQLACAPGPALQVAQVLSAQWEDDNGDEFQSTVTAAYDFSNQILAIDNSIIISELARDSPLLYANTHHAMVICETDYFSTPYGPNIRNVGVLDPWPYSPAFHPLQPQEAYPVHTGGQMMFLAAVAIDD
jgi:hypothetical protein